ncbi:MAG TPA: magnesium transporter [Gammaproteobacteria bacterium]|nr:magnesium transporter [Gammaproteobacteria bacterium]
MTADRSVAVNALNRRFMLDYPLEAAKRLEELPGDEVAAMLAVEPLDVVLPVWNALSPDAAETVLPHLPDESVRRLIAELEPARSIALLNRLDTAARERCLSILDRPVASELRKLLEYAPATAGQLMDPRVLHFRGDMAVHQVLEKLRAGARRGLREIFVVDAGHRPAGRVDVQDLAMADPEQTLDQLIRPIAAVVTDLESRDEVVSRLEKSGVTELPVVDYSGQFVGVIRQSGLVSAVEQEVSLDIQTMVGASRDERALSKASFAVRKRLPWLEINLVTAFLAASVVGLFESTIAKFTALAVLLPVVAGQSGNAGAQALAVTMRGLALREIGMRHWLKVVIKEVQAGFLNGVAIALTTALGVYVWSGSHGLALVISVSMVIAMVAAGFAGAIIPILLTRFGQDPAQSSSIVLTTVTDVVGFFSFLGIATLLAGLL